MSRAVVCAFTTTAGRKFDTSEVRAVLGFKYYKHVCAAFCVKIVLN